MAQDEGTRPQNTTVSTDGPSPNDAAEVDLREKSGVARMVARAGTGRLQPMRGFDEDYTDIVDYIVRCTH